MTEFEVRKELKELIKDDKRISAEEYEALEKAIFALEEIEEYRVIGTVEEFKALKEKELPFKVGDTAYIIVGKNVSRQKIVWIELRDYAILFITRRRKFSNSDIGECVFHTKEEAEKALVDSRLN